MKQTRYALLIGINDYSTDPLRYCKNDVLEVEKKLINNCKFFDKNIHKIISEDINPIKDITGKYLEIIDKISKKFKIGEDLLFFYFAGHGRYHFEESNIQFHDTLYSIRKIFEDLSIFNPKFQFYIIDACYSGGKVITKRGNNQKDEDIDKHIQNSSGILFLFASQAHETASENSNDKHGLLTKYFLESIDFEAHYEDEILTPGRIQEYVSKKTSEASRFEQIPVIENRTTGYFPFAFLNINKNDDLKKNPNVGGLKTRNISEEDLLDYSLENRFDLQDLAANILEEKINSNLEKFSSENFKVTEFEVFDDYDPIDFNKLIEEIVVGSRANSIESIQGILFTEKEIIETNTSYFSNIFIPYSNFLNSFSQRNKPKYKLSHGIKYYDDYLKLKNIVFISSDFSNSSFGFGYLIYQAKWGLGYVFYFYRLDWDGEKDSILKDINISFIPLLLKEDSIKKIGSFFEKKLMRLLKICNYSANFTKKK